MNEIAVTHVNVKTLIVSLVGAAILLFALVGTAVAGPVGRDGKIHACYKVKGKPKGTLRVVPAKQKRCKRGERKVAWSAASMTGGPGSNGTAGTSAGGSAGPNGSSASNGTDGSTEAALKTQISSLNVKIDGLEKTLDGVTNGELTDAVGVLPVVDALCAQNEELASQINLMAGVIEGLGLSSALEALGLLEIPDLPDPLGTLGCGTTP